MSNLPISPDPDMHNEAPPGATGDLSILQRIMQTLRAITQWLHAETLEGMLINLKDLPLTHRILTAAGYLAVICLLAVALLVEVLGPDQPSARYIIPRPDFGTNLPFVANLSGLPLSLPWLALAGVLLAFILGWTYLLSGATECRRRIFLPILVVFIFQIFLTGVSNPNELSDAQILSLIVPCLCLPGAGDDPGCGV